MINQLNVSMITFRLPINYISETSLANMARLLVVGWSFDHSTTLYYYTYTVSVSCSVNVLQRSLHIIITNINFVGSHPQCIVCSWEYQGEIVIVIVIVLPVHAQILQLKGGRVNFTHCMSRPSKFHTHYKYIPTNTDATNMAIRIISHTTYKVLFVWAD